MRFFLEYATTILFLLYVEKKKFGLSKCSSRITPLSSVAKADVEDIDSNTVTPIGIEEKYKKMLAWLKSKDGVYINEKLSIRPSSRGGGFGAFVVADNDHVQHDSLLPVIEKDEILFTIPRAACITLNDALGDKDYGAGFKSLIDKAGPGGNTVVLAGYMAAEWLKCIEQSNEESRYGSYLATLPWSRGINQQEHILYWDDDQIESSLKGSLCYGEAVDLRNEMKVAIKVLNTIIGRALLEKEQGKGFRLPWERKERTHVPEVKGLADAIIGAFVSVLTRAFEDDFGDKSDQEKMVPLLDMLQHSDKPNVSHFMRKSDGAVEVRAKTAFNHNDELLNQYRSEAEENLPYYRFFTRFGFVPGIQEPIESLLQDKSSIFFAQKAEV